jgi:hypothetical protein
MPAAKPAGAIPPERLASYERAVATLPGVERKGATVPYTSVNGNMFSYLGPTGTLALRLSSADRKAFIARFHATLHEAYGVVQKEYLTVPDDLLADTQAIAPYMAASYAYVSALRPKSTTRKAATG